MEKHEGTEERKEIAEQTPKPEGHKLFVSRYTRTDRAKAWVGVILMVLLTLGFAWCFASGKILLW